MGQKVVAVDPDRSSLKSVADFNRRIQVLRMNAGGKTVERLMSLLENILNVFEFGNSNDGSENLFLHNLHLLIDTGEDCGLNEITFFAMTFAAEFDFSTLVLSGLDVIHDSCELEFRDLWTLDCLGFEWVTDNVLLCASSKFLHEFVIDIFLDVDTRSGATTLTLSKQEFMRWKYRD